MPDVPTLTPPDRWASIARRESPSVGEYTHIVAKGHPTSACGTTALPASMWRGNTTKPMCPQCVAAHERKTPGA